MELSRLGEGEESRGTMFLDLPFPEGDDLDGSFYSKLWHPATWEFTVRMFALRFVGCF